ncbi:hypothetical protein PARPLA_01183 [Rhodobacteraceae bacterium THAF1]|uniref:hypothetical protein n=1 Tax=Palleronia sp. THAF1 TaxID=2587842 RepID=UPI000F3EC551|nr:hypothetical protein [Palleronia sp. THAF1]QFU07294.1 hypothetical protein FIU81_01265 [Palleronia sp. THAF1]VDC20794.1 hypothetical protein PARPLA_01183 [Rhodobacteraceae bacterium THAF1]
MVAEATAEWAKGVALGLDRAGRVAMAWASLKSLDGDDAVATAESVLGGAGSPLPPFLSPMNDARWWASLANRAELKAYTLAAFQAMRPVDQAAFLDHVQGRAAA